ncbi:hypothetical protein KC901_00475, partial [Patescibacteria group bacterium]|nr:hypothetical protein [Patescibacteria group bacterium]
SSPPKKTQPRPNSQKPFSQQVTIKNSNHDTTSHTTPPTQKIQETTTTKEVPEDILKELFH